MFRLTALISILFSINLYAEQSRVYETHTLSSEPNPIDILLVIDVSEDMHENQKKLALALPDFLAQVQAPYQVAITNSDMQGGQNSRQGHFYKLNDFGKTFITPDDADGTVLLKSAILAKGSTEHEEPLKATVENIAQYASSDFYRKNTDLITIYLSNEDEHSNGPNWATKPGHVLKAMEVSFRNKFIYSYGFIVPPEEDICLNAQGLNAAYGTHIDYLNQITDGKSFSVCENSYTQSLLQVAKKMNRKAHYILLNNVPKSGTVMINFSNQHLSTWHIKENKIYFHNPPTENIKVEINYEKSLQIIKPK